MRAIDKFADKTPGPAEVQKTFAPIESEIAELKKAITILSSRKKDAETILACVDTETANRKAEYQRTLAEGDTDAAKAIPDTLKQIEAKTFEAQNEIIGLNNIISAKKERLEALEKELSKKEFLLGLANMYPLIDKYNTIAAALGETMLALHQASDFCYIEAQKNGLSFEQHLKQVSNMELIPTIFFDLNDVRNIPRHEASFWDAYIYWHDRTRRSSNR